jgi:hypothetical protein
MNSSTNLAFANGSLAQNGDALKKGKSKLHPPGDG